MASGRLSSLTGTLITDLPLSQYVPPQTHGTELSQEVPSLVARQACGPDAIVRQRSERWYGTNIQLQFGFKGYLKLAVWFRFPHRLLADNRTNTIWAWGEVATGRRSRNNMVVFASGENSVWLPKKKKHRTFTGAPSWNINKRNTSSVNKLSLLQSVKLHVRCDQTCRRKCSVTLLNNVCQGKQTTVKILRFRETCLIDSL